MKRFLRFLIALAGLGLGCALTAVILNSVRFPGYAYPMRYTTLSEVLIALYVIVGFLGGLIFYIIAPGIMARGERFVRGIRQQIIDQPAILLAFGAAGVLVGLLGAMLIGFLVNRIQIPAVASILNLVLYVLLAYWGGKLGIRCGRELRLGGIALKDPAPAGSRPKVLDTSAIIDGRILDVARTGFLEGELVVPEFVLKELRHIADSSDALKRAKGRRGLDILKELQQKGLPVEVTVTQRDYDEVDEVDAKLLRLAKELEGSLVTNDYNLNKVAAVQQTQVMNINDLANAVRPVLLPGEEVSLQVVKEGKEQGQGVGYLPDGTMVIIEGGKKKMGETVDLTVTSSLQTSAGRLIFARLR